MKNTRKFWQSPWRYKETAVCVGSIVFLGVILQLLVGSFDFTKLQFPVNVILGGILFLFLLAFSIKRKSPFYQWFSGVQMAVALIISLVFLTIVMGFIPQVTNSQSVSKGVAFHLGLTHLTSAWYFVLIYFLTLLSLGALIIRRLCSFKIKDYAFYFNHIGLWILLFAAGMGTADIKRYVMYIREGETQWQVYNSKNEIIALPIAIKLNDFYMEEYPPKLTVIDKETGLPQPKDKPDYFQIDEKQLNGQIAGWAVSVKQYIHESVSSSDSTYYKAQVPLASPAAKVNIINPSLNVYKEGWVCAGNIFQLYQVLNLNEQYCLAMTRPEPKRFYSDITIYTADGKQAHTVLEVNKPYKIGNWMLYQYGYDSNAGKLSMYSSIELVYDPWIIPVYVGIMLLACGVVCLLWIGNKRKEKNNDVE